MRVLKWLFADPTDGFIMGFMFASGTFLVGEVESWRQWWFSMVLLAVPAAWMIFAPQRERWAEKDS